LTQRGSVTFKGMVTNTTGPVPGPEMSLLMMFSAHDVWFRSFRDKLSRMGIVSPLAAKG
jgi:hypothetical protein